METAPPPELPDQNLLLRRYLREESEAAFRALAERCLPLVWGVARRVLNGNSALAEDVAQTVLADFARMAPGLSPGTMPSAWLHRHTVFLAMRAARTERRRHAREQAWASRDAGPESASMNDTPDEWTDLAPRIDAALNRLPAADRGALLLRYFDQRPLREVGLALGISEEAARKRIARALTKLRFHLRGRGVVPAVLLLAGMLTEKSLAVPDAVARRVISGAWQRVEAGAFSVMPAATRPVWWRRRSARATVVAAVLALPAWLLTRGGESGGKGPSHLHPRILSGREGALESAADLPVVKVATTFMLLPERTVRGRMLRYSPGEEDAVLYRELLPQAEALQKQVPPAEVPSFCGQPLVILSGEGKSKRLAVTAPPEGADPFAPSSAGTPGPFPAEPVSFPQASISLRRYREHPYATGWKSDGNTGEVKVTERDSRNTGCAVELNVSPPEEDGSCLAKGRLEYMFAPPGEARWRYRTPPEGEDPARDSLTQPVFYSFGADVLARLKSGAPVLVAMQTVSADFLPPGSDGAARLLVFLTLQP